MKKKFEVWGHKLELIGLIVALMAAIWQSSFSGWWETESPEWQYWIQEEVNFATLRALSDVALMHDIQDPARKKEISNKASLDARKAISKAIDMRNDRKEALKGQASLFSNIRITLFLFGAILIIIGKFLIYKSVKYE